MNCNDIPLKIIIQMTRSAQFFPCHRKKKLFCLRGNLNFFSYNSWKKKLKIIYLTRKFFCWTPVLFAVYLFVMFVSNSVNFFPFVLYPCFMCNQTKHMCNLFFRKYAYFTLMFTYLYKFYNMTSCVVRAASQSEKKNEHTTNYCFSWTF